MSLALSDPGDRPNEIGQSIANAAEDIAANVDELLSALSAQGCFRVHSAWEPTIEKRLACRMAAEAAIRAVLKNGWVDVPQEVEHDWMEH